MEDTDSDADDCRYESECCRLVQPFLRVAALVRHYVFQQVVHFINLFFGRKV
jgi:hypothetical protein